jgi:chromosome segregation ATPase
MADKKLVAQLLVEAGASAQNIEEVQNALVKSGDAGVKAADRITTGLQAIEKGSGQALAKTAQGVTVSDSELGKLATRFAAVDAAVKAAFGSVEKAPAEIQQAVQTAQEQIIAANKSVIELGASTDGAAEKFKNLAQKAIDAGKQIEKDVDAATAAQKRQETATKAAGDAMVRVVNNAKEAEKGLEEAIEGGSPRMGTALSKLRNVYVVLGDQIKAAEKDGRALPQETIAEYERLGKVIQAQIPIVRRMTDEMKEQKTEIGEGGEQWLGLGNSINKALGPMGAVQARAALVGAALVEGFRIGSTAAQKMGLDTTLLDSELEKVGHSIGNITTTFTSTVWSLLSGNFKEAKNEAEKLDVAMGLLSHGVIADQGAINGFNLAIDSGIKLTADYTQRVNDAAKIEEKHIELLKLGRVGQQLWNIAVKEANGDFDAFIKKLEATEPVAKRYREALAAAEKVLESHNDQVKNAIEHEKGLIKAHDDEIAKIDELVKHVTGEDAARQHLHDTIMKELQLVAQYEQAKDGTSKSIEQLATDIASLSVNYDANAALIQQLAGELVSQTAKTLGASDETKKHAVAIGDDAKKIEDLTARNKDLNVTIDQIIAARKEETAAGFAAFQAAEKELDANKLAIEAAKDRIASQSRLLGAVKEEASAKIQLIEVNGRMVVSNEKVAESTGKAASSNIDFKEKVADASRGIKDSSDIIAAAFRKAHDEGKGFEDAVAAAAAEVAKAHSTMSPLEALLKSLGDRAKETAGDIEPIRQKLVDLEKQYESLQKSSGLAAHKMADDMVAAAKSIEGSIDKIEKSMDRLDKATSKAAGTSSTSKQSGLQPVGPGAPVTSSNK